MLQGSIVVRNIFFRFLLQRLRKFDSITCRSFDTVKLRWIMRRGNDDTGIKFFLLWYIVMLAWDQPNVDNVHPVDNSPAMIADLSMCWKVVRRFNSKPCRVIVVSDRCPRPSYTKASSLFISWLTMPLMPLVPKSRVMFFRTLQCCCLIFLIISITRQWATCYKIWLLISLFYSPITFPICLFGYPCGIWLFSPIADIRDKIPRLTRIFGIKIEKSHNRLSENGMHKNPMVFQKWVDG